MAAASAARPQLRGLLARSTKIHTIGCIAFATVNVLLFKFFVRDARIKKYEDFYKNYDPEREFQRMRKAGVFTSAPPDK